MSRGIPTAHREIDIGFSGFRVAKVQHDVSVENVVPDAGIEPATFGLQNRCSTI